MTEEPEARLTTAEDVGHSEPTEEEVFAGSLEFGILVFKTRDGDYGVKAIDDYPKAKNLVEIQAACNAVSQNIKAQEVAQMVAQAMLQVAQASRTAAGNGRTEGGLIVPNDVKGN